MSKKLWALNLLLVCGLALIGRELREEWKSSREREQKMLSQKMKPAAATQVPQVPAPPSVQPAAYMNVATQTLFTKDRNPNILIEPEKPKPQPLFPRFYGVMNLGDGLTAIMSDGPSKQRGFAVGEKVGEWKLAEIGADFLVFEWDTKKVTKRFSELQDRNDPVAEQTTPRGPSVAAAPAPTPPPTPARAGPGTDMGGGFSACNPNDSSPNGTVVDGKRKVMSEGMFGKTCRWESAK